jgi:cell division protein ZapE
MSTGPLEDYRALVATGAIQVDPAQSRIIETLDELAAALDEWKPSRAGFFARLSRTDTRPPPGLYIHGAVGRGKTMVMDLFFRSVSFEPKRRLHFHEFMAEVHDRIATARKTVDGDPIPEVAKAIAATSRLLCFDELHVTDIADAMILGRLFNGLFESGVVIVATSNAEPRDLYRNGLNRQLFLPFIELIERHMRVLELAAARDFRMDKLAGRRLFFSPADAAARAEVEALWTSLTGGEAGGSTTLEVKARKVFVPRAAMGVARFAFSDLCEKPLGSLDYLQIAHAFHTIIIEHIPLLGPARRNEARRFINLIDTLYDNRICLIATSDAEPDKLYPQGDGADLFVRTASRLTEMRSEAYLADRAMRRSGLAGPGGLVV